VQRIRDMSIQVYFLPHYYMIFNGENVSVHVKLDIKWIKLLLVNCHQNGSHPVNFTFLGALPFFFAHYTYQKDTENIYSTKKIK
jgi:hypothetical protein